MAKGFHQVMMDPVDAEKTAFSTPRGHFEFKRMPFGLKNAPASFQRMINAVLSDYINNICIIYMDDILIFSTSLAEHLESLSKIFKRLKENCLKVQYDKCQFLRRETKFLGHIVTRDGIKPGEEKIKAVKEVQLPKSLNEIRAFLGLTGFYRKFIKNYSLISAPIVKYLRKDARINTKDNEYITAFEKLKQILISPPLLAYPNFQRDFLVTTDASDYAIGAVLSQDGKPICYASRTLNGFERKYFIVEKELLAIIWSIKYFRPYLYGRKFRLQTDTQPLTWLYNMKDPSPRIFRWRTLLNEYDFEVEYIQGKENKVADFLSRAKKVESECEDVEIKSLFENSMESIHSAVEDANNHFLISEFLVNKYLTQIRLVKSKTIEFEKLHNKYSVIYISPKDLENSSYLVDLFRKYIQKGKIGIYSELTDTEYNIVQEKLISLYCNDPKVSFTKCTRIAIDIESKEEIMELIETTHIESNHRGIFENYEELKWRYFYPNLQKVINSFVNSCNTCNENKYDRKPIKKHLSHTVTPSKPNELVHVDIFYVSKVMYLTSIDKFTKMASAHRLTDKNMCTVVVKLQERFSWLGKPEKIIFDNEFNNALIRFFCRENGISTHFTTANSHTGNSDIERLHSTLLEHIRIIKNTDSNLGIEEIMIKAVGFYNNTIHKTTNIKPMDFLNKCDIDYDRVKDKMHQNKTRAINKLNEKREQVQIKNDQILYLRNPQAERNKTAKRYRKITKSYPNNIDVALLRRPKKNLNANALD